MKHQPSARRWILLFGIAALAAACQRGGGAPAPTVQEAVPPRPRPSAASPTLEELQNATYRGLEVGSGTVQLTAGRWDGAPYVAGSAEHPAVRFVRDFRLTGSLGIRGEQHAGVLLAETTGGSGERLYLAVVQRQDGGLDNIGTALVGDRVQVRAGRIENRRILLDLVQAGPHDAMCCPGELVTRGWEMQPAGLKEFATNTPSGRLTLDAISGTEWVLRAWSWDDAAPTNPEVTLQVQDGRFAGRSGCNTYSAMAKVGDAPGDVILGPAISTRMACAEPAAGIETRYLAQLQGIRKFGFVAGQLALTFEIDGRLGSMFFDRRPVTPAASKP